jgi:hypothetical protein
MTKFDKVRTHTVSTMGSISQMVDSYDENNQLKGNIDFKRGLPFCYQE